MAAPIDPDNYIKLFRLDDNSENSTYPEKVVIIPAGKNVFRSMFNSESLGHQQETAMETNSLHIPDEGINLLIELRHELEELFLDCGDISGIAAVLWEDISRRLYERGFTVSGKQCAAKWKALYAEYLEVAHSDDEGRVSGSRHFAAIESHYKLRCKYIDSKILEDITEYLSTRSDCPSTAGTRSDEGIGASKQSKKGPITTEEFSTLSNEDATSQTLMEAIDAAQKFLADNIRDPEHETSQGDAQTEKIDTWRYKKSTKCGDGKPDNKGDISLSLEEKNIASKTIIHCPSEGKGREDQVFLQSESTDFSWDTDATQCFLDLRLYVEGHKETKQSILRIYRSLVRFLRQKMLKNGYRVSEIDCKKKWEQLMRYYNKEVQRMKNTPAEEQNRPQLGVETYFWQMDRVLKKSGLQELDARNTEDFIWGPESIRKLIAIRMPMEHAFSTFKRYVILWQYVASQMIQYNFLPTYNECAIKWMEICEIYQICLDSVKRGAKEADIGWNFYHEMRQGFEINATSTEAVIDYKCHVKVEDQKSTKSLAACTPFSGSGAPVKTELDLLSKSEDLKIENGSNYQNVETGGGKNVLEVVIQHCNILENMLKGEDANATDNKLVGGSRAPNPPQIDNNRKIKTLGASYSLDIEDNLKVEPGNPESSCIQLPGTSGLQSADVLDVKNPFDIGVSAMEGEREQATTCNEKASTVVWTDEATTLLIKLKVSMESKFRSPSYLEMDLWKEIATHMQSAGHNVCHESCSACWYQLMNAHKNKPSSEKQYLEQMKLGKLLFTENTSTAKAPKTEMKRNETNSKATRFMWTDNAVKTLIGLKFSEEIRDMKTYGRTVANKMRAAGFSTITHSEVITKWGRINAMYKKTLFHKDMGHSVNWEYFELIHNYVKGGRGLKFQNTVQPYLWTPRAVQKLIEMKVLLENSGLTLNRRTLALLWKKIAETMVAAGFQVTHNDCATQWSFLVQSYMKTKKELRTGNGAVIGKYFILMDKALNLFNKSDNDEEDTKAPINFSMTSQKRELEDSWEENTKSSDAISSEKDTSVTFSEKFTETEKQDKSNESIADSAIDLSLRIAVPSLNCTPVGTTIESKRMPDSKMCVSSSVDSSPVFNLNKEKDISPNVQQEEVKVSLYKEACSSSSSTADHQMIVINDHVDSSKENFACVGMETRSKSRVNMRKYAPHMKNTLTQSQAVNSLGSTEGGDLNERWSEAGTHLLIDLKLEHNDQFVGWHRSEMKWAKISTQLARLGYNYTSEECKERWHSLKTTYEQKIAEIRAKRTVQSWPYFRKIDSFYERLGNLYHGFRYILPKKRARNEEGELLNPPKKLAVSMKAAETRLTHN